MLATNGGFVAILPKKEVELGADRLLHRADHAAELAAEISFEASKAATNEYAHLPGGALRAINPNSSMTMAHNDTCAAVFKGNLANKGELALGLVGCPPHLNEAELLLRLYEAAGLDMLGKLGGQFAFCLYDSKQARVLAARDHSGAVPLLEGRTASGSLLIACGTYLPEGAHQMVAIDPGHYKWGWHALPRAFKTGARVVAGRASCEYGIRRRSVDAFNAPPAQHHHGHGHRQASGGIDIPSGRSRHASHTGAITSPSSMGAAGTPGRYLPPHAAFSRQRATSLDSGHWGPAPTLSSSAPGVQQQQHTGGGGRRKSETTSHATKPGRQHQQPPTFKAAQVPVTAAATPAAARAVSQPPAASAAAAAAKAAAAALATAAAATSAPPPLPAASNKPPTLAAIVPPAGPNSPGSDGPPSAAGAHGPASADDGSSPHRRKRRHRSRKNKHSPGAAGDGASSDTESQVSTATHESSGSAGKAPAAAAGKKGQGGAAAAAVAAATAAANGLPAAAAKASTPTSGAAAGRKGPQQHTPIRGSHGHQHKQQQQQQQQQQAGAWGAAQRRSSTSGGGSSADGFQRTGSCGELAALATSPTTANGAAAAGATHPVLLGPQPGLAC